jgi:CubicO group peptidase (beta-lactamase class C family)
VRHLLNQVSGLPQSIGQKQIANSDLSDAAIENNVRALAKVELIAPPGERYEYSNANFVTLGMIIQEVSGQSYETYIQEQIFQPLDMQNSFTSKTEAQKDGLAVGHQKWFGISVASPDLPFVRGSLPAGYLNMSIEDFGHHLIAQFNDGICEVCLYSLQPVFRHPSPRCPDARLNRLCHRLGSTALSRRGGISTMGRFRIYNGYVPRA